MNIYYDTEAPIFGVPDPEPDSWVNTNSVNYEITLRDQDGSGVRGTSIEYSTSFDGGQSFTAWEPAGIRRGRIVIIEGAIVIQAQPLGPAKAQHRPS